jgi:uncharacterized repeat protein (TIGR01451 family)
VVIVVNTTTDGTLTNEASATSDTVDPDSGNNSASEETTVNPAAGPEADLAVSKSEAVDPVTVGDDVTYMVNVSNNGPDTAQNVVLTDNLPGGVTFVSVTPGAPDCTESSGVVTCNLGDMASGASVDVVIVVNTTTDGTITNEASATSDTVDPDSGNNSASEDTTVNPSPPTEIIVDNLDPEFTTSGWWNTYSGTRYPSYNDSFRYTREGSGERQATFTPNIVNAGDYEVFIWYFTTPGSATNTPYTINFNGGSTTIRLNCQGDIGGGYWYSLGVYNFASGTSGNIVISNDADGYVEADAVRLLQQ